MSYSKKKHKYIRKYLNKSGNMIYVYANTNLGDLRGGTTNVRAYNVPVRSVKSGLKRVANAITGSEFKKAAADAGKMASHYDSTARSYARAENKYRSKNLGVIQDGTTMRLNGGYNRSKQLASDNRSSRYKAMDSYRNGTVAGALEKVKNKTKFTALKGQRKVSKLLKKLSKK